MHRYDDDPREPPHETMPPEAAALRERLDAATDRERISLLSEHAVEQTRISIEARNRVYGYHEHTHRELAGLREGQEHLANGLLTLAEGQRALARALKEAEDQRHADALAQAEATGLLARELADLRRGQTTEAEVRAKADSIYEERVGKVEQKTDAVEKKTEQVEKKADALAVIKPWLVGGAKVGAQGGVTALVLKALEWWMGQ